MTTWSRWCPRCQGAKSPSEPLCIGCAVTVRERAAGLAGRSLADLRLLRSGLAHSETVRYRGIDYTYDDIMDELHRREANAS